MPGIVQRFLLPRLGVHRQPRPANPLPLIVTPVKAFQIPQIAQIVVSERELQLPRPRRAGQFC